MTRDEAMARLRAVDPLPVGERLARWTDRSTLGVEGNRASAWMKLKWRHETWDVCLVRAYARPLRHARERARTARAQWALWTTKCEQMRDAYEAETARLRDEKDFARQVVNDSLVGESLLRFFEQLSVLVRKTPAPCPWCGSVVRVGMASQHDEDSAVQCDCGGPMGLGCGARSPVEPDDDDAIREWNRVAVPAAYRRLR